MSINHTHDFGVLEELTANNHTYITQSTADGIPTIWVACDELLDVLLFYAIAQALCHACGFVRH